MQAVLENDRRGIKRRHLIFHLRVFDRETGEKLGHVVDISAEGMMLVSESAIDVDRDYKLQMRLPDEEDRPTTHDFEGRTVWSSNDVNPAFFDTGFQVIQASEEHIELVRHLVDLYGFRD